MQKIKKIYFYVEGGKKPTKKKTPKLSPKSEIPQLEGRTVIPNNKWEPVRSHQCSWIITNIAQENQIPWRVWCFLQIYSFAGYSSCIWYQLSQQTNKEWKVQTAALPKLSLLKLFKTSLG